jgi:hypothetical protein
VLSIPRVSRLAELRRDLQRAAAGIVALLRFSRSRDCIQAGISILSATSPTVSRGGRNRYTVGIANAGSVARTLVLVLELAPVAVAPSTRSRALVAKAFTVNARTVSIVDVVCDWQHFASLTIGAWSVPCDRALPGEETLLRDRCTVAALLLDLRGQPLDRVTIEQEAAP